MSEIIFTRELGVFCPKRNYKVFAETCDGCGFNTQIIYMEKFKYSSGGIKEKFAVNCSLAKEEG